MKEWGAGKPRAHLTHIPRRLFKCPHQREHVRALLFYVSANSHIVLLRL